MPVLVPAAVLAQALYGDRRDAPANRVLGKLQIVAVTEPVARVAAELKRAARTTGVPATIDAMVVAVSAAAGGGVVLTSDDQAIRRLAGGVSGVRIRAIPI